MNEANVQGQAAAQYRPRLSYYHPNGKNTGSALQLELHPAHDSVGGSIFVSIAPQKTVGVRGEGGGSPQAFPSFDWKNKLSVKLDISDLVQMLSVFRGIQESIADGKGLFHRSASAVTAIHLEHKIEPMPGYAFDIWRKPSSGEARRVGFFFTTAEAFGLATAVEQVLGVIAFGIPMVIPRSARLPENAGAEQYAAPEYLSAEPDMF